MKRNRILFREETVAIPTLKNHLIKVVKDKASTFTNVANALKNRRIAINMIFGT